jgi:hypothetical protein
MVVRKRCYLEKDPLDEVFTGYGLIQPLWKYVYSSISIGFVDMKLYEREME